LDTTIKQYNMNELNKAFKAIAKGRAINVELNGNVILSDIDCSIALNMLDSISTAANSKGEQVTFDNLQTQYSRTYNIITLCRTFFEGSDVATVVELTCKIEH